MSKKYYDEHGNQVEVETTGRKRGGCLRWVLIIIGALVLFGACSALLADDTDTSTESDESTTEEVGSTEEESEVEDSAGAELLTVGDSYTIDDITFTVNNTYYTDERNEFAETDPENVIAIEYTLENNSDEDYPFGVDTQVYADGQQMESYPLGTDLGSVSSGRSVESTTYYGINGEKVELEWEPFFSFSGDKGIWDITPD